jgi:hypothetical protein
MLFSSLVQKKDKDSFFHSNRGVAQPGSALGSGPRSREFKSPLPDHHLLKREQATF